MIQSKLDNKDKCLSMVAYEKNFRKARVSMLAAG